MEKSQQEMMYRFNMFEQQMKLINQQLDQVQHVLIELSLLEKNMDDLKGKKGEEIMAHLGKGIYAKAKLISEDLVVDIGEGNFIKKDIDGTKNLIAKQIRKLEDVQKELINGAHSIEKEMMRMVEEAEQLGN